MHGFEIDIMVFAHHYTTYAMLTNMILVSFCIPVCDEEQILVPALFRIDKTLHNLFGAGKYEILIIENGSTDNTPKILQKLNKRTFKILSIHQKKHGRAFRMAIKHARGEHVVLTAIDLPFGFRDLKKAMKIWDRYDLIYGSKAHPDSVINRSWKRRVSSKIYSLLNRLLFGIRVLDTQGSVFLNRKKILSILPRETSENAFFTTELAIYAQRNKLPITEIPVTMVIQNLRKSHYHILSDGWRMVQSMMREWKRLHED
jgi:dolichyl-phosphate beta-glucosyltransferase